MYANRLYKERYILVALIVCQILLSNYEVWHRDFTTISDHNRKNTNIETHAMHEFINMEYIKI